jgi:hypothetical protein
MTITGTCGTGCDDRSKPPEFRSPPASSHPDGALAWLERESDVGLVRGDLVVDEAAQATGLVVGLGGEDLGVVGEGLELQRVACRVEQEHRPLLTRLPCEAHMRLDDEGGACRP